MRLSDGEFALVHLESRCGAVEERVNLTPVVDVTGALKAARSYLVGRYIHSAVPGVLLYEATSPPDP